ncbi:MAG: hypothetical protein ACLRFE_03450, partial [Clostridia bacterium]
MKKRLGLLIMSFILIVGASIGVSCFNLIQNNTDTRGSNPSFNINYNPMPVTADTNYADYFAINSSGVITNYTGNFTEITIPETINGIT